MPKGDKYAELTSWLQQSNKEHVSVTFDEIKAILGFLPPSAYKFSTFWGNDGSVSSHFAWLNAGYRAKNMNLTKQQVEFVQTEIAHSLPRVPKVVKRKSPEKKIRCDIPTPSPEEVENYLEKWRRMENYSLQENALNKLFSIVYPTNTNLDDVLVKTAVLNEFYSTSIFNVFPVAKHIVSLDIDARLQCGDVSLVEDIATVEISGKAKRFYSFATKYCSHHKPNDFPIYDSYVEKILQYYSKVDCFAEFGAEALKEFPLFKNILLDFRAFYGLESYGLKEIDQFLWQVGKEKFPKKYYK